jgi:methionyl-tRNA synthetase
MPESSKNIYSQLGLSGDPAAVDPADLSWSGLSPGTAVKPGEGVFPRIEKAKIMSEIKEQTADGEPAPEAAVAAGGSAQSATASEPEYITIDDFLKVQLRIGEVKVAERVPNADKLLRMEVDIGEDKPRQLVAGLAEYYEPEKLVGRKVVVVANLKPRKLRGLESQGMICAASLDQDDTPAVATFIEDVKIGARLK